MFESQITGAKSIPVVRQRSGDGAEAYYVIQRKFLLLFYEVGSPVFLHTKEVSISQLYCPRVITIRIEGGRE